MVIPRNILLMTCLLLVGWGQVILQQDLDAALQRRHRVEFAYLPNGRQLKPLMLDFDMTTADYYWIRTILYFGTHVPNAEMPLQYTAMFKGGRIPNMGDWVKPNLGSLYPALNLVTDLDPRFAQPYIFGGLFLSAKAGEVDQALALLEKGRRHCPNEWRIPYFQGYNYLFYKQDPRKALECLTAATRIPGYPSMVDRLINGILHATEQHALLRDFLTGLLSTERDEDTRQRLKEWIDRLDRELSIGIRD